MNMQPADIIYHFGPDGKVIGRYKKGRLLGEGGFAKCYQVTLLENGQQSAAKIIDKLSITSQKTMTKLKMEIYIHRNMDNENIVQFEKFFQTDHHYIMILELCNQQSLMELHKKRRRFTEMEVNWFMRQIMNGVSYMHSRNIIHRDLKLGNLFLDDDFHIKIGDFGLAAQILYDGEKKTTICGTPNYIAPEILNSSKHGHSFEVDIWSMGVIMYTLLSGKPPFEMSDVKSTYQKIRNNSYTFPSNIEISNSAKDLIQQILQSNPEKRPTLEEMKDHAFFKLCGPVSEAPMSLKSQYLPYSPTAQLVSPPLQRYSTAPVSPHDPSGALSPRAAQATPSEPYARTFSPPAHRRLSDAQSSPPVSSSSSTSPQRRGSDSPTASAAMRRQSDSPAPRLSSRPGTPDTYRNPLGESRHTPDPYRYAPDSYRYTTERATPDPYRPSSTEYRHNSAADPYRSTPDTYRYSTEPRAAEAYRTPSPALSVRSPVPRTASPSLSSTQRADGIAAYSRSPTPVNYGTHSALYQRPHSARPATPSSPNPNSNYYMSSEASPRHYTDFAYSAKVASPAVSSPTAELYNGSSSNSPRRLSGISQPRSPSSPSLQRSPQSHQPSEGIYNHGISCWVAKYCDFTSHYGMAYKLSSNYYGALFNDDTSIIWDAVNDRIEYSSKEKDSDIRVFNSHNYPEELKKKVNLLHYFYKQFQNPGLAVRTMIDLPTTAPVRGALPHVLNFKKAHGSLVFQLSNDVLQGIFDDGTDLIYNATNKTLVVFKDNQRNDVKLSQASYAKLTRGLQTKVVQLLSMLG